MEQFNQSALADILLELAEATEHLTKELLRIKGAVYSDDRLRERYLAGVLPGDAELHEGSIRLLRQRLASISRELKHQ